MCQIGVTKGFLDVRATENDVEKNILVVAGSNYPDTKKGNGGAGRFAKTADEGAAEKNHFYRLCVFKNSEQKKKRERHIE